MNQSRIITRSEWGARAPGGQLTRMSRYDGIVVHHSAGPQPADRQQGIRTVRNIQLFHQEDREFIDIGYNFLVDGAGNVYEGRGSVGSHLARGAHSPGVNSTRIGICVMGCFHPSEPNCSDTLTDAQRDGLVELCKFLIARFWIEEPFLTGHRDHRQTACPGDVLFGMLPNIRLRVGGDLTLTIPTPQGA